MKNSGEDQGVLIRCYSECAAFVLLWVALGFYLRLGSIAYQLLGLPLMAGFQVFVARRPLAQLWVREARRFEMNGRTVGLALALIAGCGAALWSGQGRLTAAPERAKLFALIVAAALPAAFAILSQRKADLRRAAAIIVVAATVRVAWRVMWALPAGEPWMIPASHVAGFFADTAGEFVALFLVDEVVFRGALDPHVCPAGASRPRAWTSAVFVSVLWAVWHLPAYAPWARNFGALWASIGPFSLFAVTWGTMLSFCARRSRTLVPTVALHGMGNAYALALMR